MKLLAIETATESCSAALLLNDELFSVSEIAPRRHNEIVLSMCEQVLSQGQTTLSQLDAIAFGRGPGAFTGLRLAASVTQGIAIGQDLPVVPVSSLAAMAQAAFEGKRVTNVLSCIDARMHEIYFAQYKLNDDQIMELVGDEKVAPPNAINIDVNDECYGVGSGWKPYAEILHQTLGKKIAFDENVFPLAEYVAKLAKVYFEQGKSVSAVEALPVYLRDNVAQKPKNKVVF
jgi:tRNA threonylcarbamoyladenosine biosynthesis protein TsaB